MTSTTPIYTVVPWYFDGAIYTINNSVLSAFTSSDNTNCPLTFSCLKMNGDNTNFTGIDPCSFSEINTSVAFNIPSFAMTFSSTNPSNNQYSPGTYTLQISAEAGENSPVSTS